MLPGDASATWIVHVLQLFAVTPSVRVLPVQRLADVLIQRCGYEARLKLIVWKTQ